MAFYSLQSLIWPEYISHGRPMYLSLIHISMGMIMADRVSVRRGILDVSVARQAELLLLRVISIDTSPLKVPTERILQAMRKDKKQTSTALTAVLLANYGEVAELNVVHDIQPEEKMCIRDRN